MKKNLLDKIGLAFGIIGIIAILAFPLILWDALGNGADYFIRFGNPGVSGDSSGNSSVSFFFGLIYTFKHMDSGFIPTKLFSSQWRVMLGVESASGTPASDALAKLSLAVVILLLIACVYVTAMAIVQRIVKDNAIVAKIDRWGAVGVASIALFALIVIAIPTIGMATKVSKFGGIGFKPKDYAAFGGYKGIIEMAIAFVLLAVNGIKFGLSFVKAK